MNTLEAILQRLGSAYDRAMMDPNPQMSDEDIMRLYRGKYNSDYVTPDALRDVELGVQRYLAKAPAGIATFFLDDVRDRALRDRGLKRNQTMSDVPRRSPTGAIMEKLLDNRDEYLIVPKKSEMSKIY